MLKVDSSRLLLLVEGQDDQHFIQQLWNKHYYQKQSKALFYTNQKPPFGILDKKGAPSLISGITEEIDVPDREVLGILVDADNDFNEQWRKITGELQTATKHPQAIPKHPDPMGTIINNYKVGAGKRELRIGIWIMPDNESPGELEDFAAKMVPEDDPVWPSSREYIANIPEENRKFDSDKAPKAELFAWLATRKEPGRMGAAIGADDLSLNNQPSKTFLKWLTALFG